MKIGIISDTHISQKSEHLPKKILDEFKTVDMVLHAGDLISLSVLDELKKVCKTVYAVRGNMDTQEVKQKLNEKEIIQAGKYRIGLMHGSGNPAKLMELLSDAFQQDKVDVIVFGHSHYPVNEKRKGILYFNPGSAMDKVFAEYNSYGILEINGSINAKIIKL
ncbi:MAG: metallophosphoesterase family protein [Candidatus Omnitrophica bacterium]|nr:metallophosphoesterase family protein [Candidatus Omnitrophota bacterium]MDD5237276.1 metallophosphoesterase family protein [Candidatus Omnitrophota bacterium]MDD5610376.1 metallophosphoesterase family protein [Candidatus Omnitrophota bacterium]